MWKRLALRHVAVGWQGNLFDALDVFSGWDEDLLLPRSYFTLKRDDKPLSQPMNVGLPNSSITPWGTSRFDSARHTCRFGLDLNL